MTYFLDTDTCIFALRGRFSLTEKFKKVLPGEIRIPSMTVAELYVGVRRCGNPLAAGRAVEAFLTPYTVVPFDALAAIVYAEIRAGLEKEGVGIGPNDLIIAATVLAHHGTLVTHNTGEFKRVPGLQLTDWTH